MNLRLIQENSESITIPKFYYGHSHVGDIVGDKCSSYATVPKSLISLISWLTLIRALWSADNCSDPFWYVRCSIKTIRIDFGSSSPKGSRTSVRMSHFFEYSRFFWENWLTNKNVRKCKEKDRKFPWNVWEESGILKFWKAKVSWADSFFIRRVKKSLKFRKSFVYSIILEKKK